MTDKIINKINELLKLADEVYREDGNDDNFYNRTMLRIDGMIDALSMITNKEYTIRDNRLQEKEEHPGLKAKKLITIRFNDKHLDIIEAVQKYGEGEIIRRVNEAIKAYYEDPTKAPMTWDDGMTIYVKPLNN